MEEMVRSIVGISHSGSSVERKQASYSEEKSDLAMVNKQNEPTPQAKRLHEALNKRDIHNELEFDDGYKHTDISIPWARLNLEINGKYHLTDPEHLFRDLERDSYSRLDGIDTIRIPNFYIDSHLDEIANAIAEVARKRQERGIPQKSHEK
jgi:very-short-patch-repair endonuclease